MIALLKPSASFSKLVTATSPFAVHPPNEGPFYAAVLEGDLELQLRGHPPERLGAGDFVLLPASEGLVVTSRVPPVDQPADEPVEVRPGVFHLGASREPDTQMMIGYCAFGSHDASLLVSLLPGLVVVRGEQRLTTLVTLLSQEARSERPGRDAVLARLLEVLLIEAFRSTTSRGPAPGLLRGLADERLALALRRMHGEPTRAWTVGALAREAGLSRSTFFEQFGREVGLTPMEYLLGWRMALAKDKLRSDRMSVAKVAEGAGYSSQSTFSVAFSRHVGMSPTAYARSQKLVSRLEPYHP